MAVQKSWQINKDLLIYKSFYFFYFGALGTILPYFPVYLRQIGLSAFAVGLLVGIRPIIQLASAPFWTVVADKFRKRKSILVMSIMAWLVMTIALVFIEPTEEICELNARNRSHSVYLNYTKLKTGFFKRSNERISQIESLTRMTRNTLKRTNMTSQALSANGNKFSNFSENHKLSVTLPFSKEVPDNSFLDLDKRRMIPTRGQTADEQKYEFEEGHSTQSDIDILPKDQLDHKNYVKEKRRDVEASVVAPIHKQRHQQNKSLSKLTKFRVNPFPSKKISSILKNALDDDKSNLTTSATFLKYTDLPIQKLTENRQNEATDVFDPFNMNGKDRTPSTQLAKFFAKSQNVTSDKPADVRYYNMNGVESRQKKPEKLNKNLTQFSLKLKLGNTSIWLGKNLSAHDNETTKSIVGKKPVDNGLAMSVDNEKSPRNKTLTVTQTNLFKSNRNEMKRLFVILLVLIVVGEFLETPSAPLSDASLLEFLGEGRIHYGKQRLWGSLGLGISSFLVGTLLERSRHLTCGEEFIDYTVCFCAFTLFMLTTLVITANFKFKYKDTERTNNSVLSTVLTVHYISFLSGACYMGMCHGLLHNFLMWFLEDLGGSKTLMGLAIGSRSSSDLITFFVASQLIETFGQIKIVFVALISYGTIFIAYSTMTNPWFALAVEFLGGFTYAASWSACTSYLAEAAPQESVATMQGMYELYIDFPKALFQEKLAVGYNGNIPLPNVGACMSLQN